jgi:hypothetical protein
MINLGNRLAMAYPKWEIIYPVGISSRTSILILAIQEVAPSVGTICYSCG